VGGPLPLVMTREMRADDGLVMVLREGQPGPERERVLSSLALPTFRLVIRLVHGLLWQLALPESVKLLSPSLLNCQE